MVIAAPSDGDNRSQIERMEGGHDGDTAGAAGTVPGVLHGRGEGGGFLVVMGQDEDEVRERLRHDPWYAHAILALVWVKRWRIIIDTWAATSGA